MTDFDRLPPDQRAVLSLLLERGKSYSEVADMLAIPERTVRERAHAALDALAEEPAGGGRSPFVGESAAGGGSRRGGADAGASASLRSRAVSQASGGGASSRGPRERSTPAGSRRGGMLLLGAIAVAIVVAAIVIVASGGKGASSTGTTSTGASTPTSSTATSSADKPKLDKTIELTAGEPELKASGLAYVLSEGDKRAFYVAAQGLPPSSGFFYAVWLYNSQSSATPLGKAPSVSSNGRMEGGGPLPSNAGSYSKLIITRETSSDPKEPGPIVLTGKFALH